MLPTVLEKAYWSRSADELIARLGSARTGLSTEEAAARIDRFGPNLIEERARFSAARLLLRQFQNPLVLILVFGAAVSLALRDWIDAAIILAIVFGSTLLGFAQEYRASAAIAALRRRLALTVRAVRDGAEQTVPARDIVPGDVILLSAGNLVPADGMILEARDFLVSEASLTGESFPVEKTPGIVPADTPLAHRTNAVFLGTSVRSGTATALVVETGRRTVFGGVAVRLKARPPETEFARGVRQFGYLLIRVMILLVVFVLVVNQVLDRPVIESLLFAMALAVGLSPELLPAIVSVTLSAGARAMARRGVIVRHLEAIENLGSIDVLCTDKTGTLTEGRISLSDALDIEGEPASELRRLAFLNAALETGIDNPLDDAIVVAGTRDGFTTANYRKIDEIPYDFMRKRLTIVIAANAHPSEHLIITKGAFANVLAACTTADRGGTSVRLDATLRERMEAIFRERSALGFRVLALATKRVEAQERYGREDESGMVFMGFLLFLDPPKPEVEAAIRDLRALGIRTKIISGDNRYVTTHLAGLIGLDAKAALTGDELAKLKDEALWRRAEETDLFVEVDPQQKERIVRALQRSGHAVAYMGDGINDAPALHAADVGISVDQAVDVARESADVVLLERDLDVLRRGVEDGRRTFVNTLKYISLTTSANFGNMVSMALATPFLPFLPLTATQILLNNFLSDLPSIAISTDNVDRASVARARHWRIRDVKWFMIVFGLISSLFDVVTFVVLLRVFSAGQATFQTAWFMVSLLTELAVVMVLRTRLPAYRSRPSRLLLWTTAIIGAVALAVPFLGPVTKAFNFVPLPAPVLFTMIAIVLAYVLTTEMAKAWFYRMFDKTGSA